MVKLPVWAMLLPFALVWTAWTCGRSGPDAALLWKGTWRELTSTAGFLSGCGFSALFWLLGAFRPKTHSPSEFGRSTDHEPFGCCGGFLFAILDGVPGARGNDEIKNNASQSPSGDGQSATVKARYSTVSCQEKKEEIIRNTWWKQSNRWSRRGSDIHEMTWTKRPEGKNEKRLDPTVGGCLGPATKRRHGNMMTCRHGKAKNARTLEG